MATSNGATTTELNSPKSINMNLSNWLCEKDPVYKELFDIKRRGWEDRTRDTRTYTYNTSRRYIDSLYPNVRNTLQLHSDVFKPCVSATATKRFLDIGSAPGATCKYLVTELNWTGFAVSLPVELGGNEMQFEHKRLLYRDLDMSADDAYDQLSSWLDEHDARGACFDFVNMGVLALYTGDNDVHEEELAQFGERTDANGQALHAVYRNSMCVAFERLKVGASCKWTLRESNLAELFRVLDIMHQLFNEVRFVLSGYRSPFDLLCVGFRRFKAEQVLQVLKSQCMPLSEQDHAYWKCEQPEAARIYEQHKALLQTIWNNRIVTLNGFLNQNNQ